MSSRHASFSRTRVQVNQTQDRKQDTPETMEKGGESFASLYDV